VDCHRSSGYNDLEVTFSSCDPLTLQANGNSSKPGNPHPSEIAPNGRASKLVPVTDADGRTYELDHGRVAIASITSCTNTSNPEVMLAAGLLAKNAVEKGLTSQPWVK